MEALEDIKSRLERGREGGGSPTGQWANLGVLDAPPPLGKPAEGASTSSQWLRWQAIASRCEEQEAFLALLEARPPPIFSPSLPKCEP